MILGPTGFWMFFRLAKANARLKIKEFVDKEDAKEIIQYYNVILLQYQQVVRMPGSPRDITYDKTVIVLKEFEKKY